MSNNNSSNPLQQQVLSPVRYDNNNVHQYMQNVSAVQAQQSQSQQVSYEPSNILANNLPFRNNIIPGRTVLSSGDNASLADKDVPNSTMLPTVGPEINNEVISLANQPVVSEANPEGDNSNALIPGSKSGQTYVDITEYLNMPQSEAAKKLGIPTSTLSKRWKEAVRGRKWPYRMICKLDKEIMTLLHNVPQGAGNGAPPFPEDIENTLTRLIRMRNDELKSVVIRI